MLEGLIDFAKTRTGMIVLAVTGLAVLYLLWKWMAGSHEGFEDGKKSLVLFYAPWCPHCKDLMPTWEKLSDKHKSRSDIVITKVDCEKEPEQATKHGVEGYPTIVLFKGGKKVATFEDDRTESAIEKFLESN